MYFCGRWSRRSTTLDNGKDVCVPQMHNNCQGEYDVVCHDLQTTTLHWGEINAIGFNVLIEIRFDLQSHCEGIDVHCLHFEKGIQRLGE